MQKKTDKILVPKKLVTAWLVIFGVLACLWASQYWLNPIWRANLAPAEFSKPQQSETITAQSIDCVYVDSVVSIYDGDTFKIDIHDWPAIVGDDISIRIKGIDTPEIRGTDGFEKEMAIAAKEQLTKIINSGQVCLFDLERDKYFRILAQVKVNNEDVAERLISLGLAKRYIGGTKPFWTESDYHEYKTKIAD
jgi:endonuclease YncB( thermonuclease family)